MMRDRAGDVAITAATGRIQPDRRWFGNTRVISQDDLDRCVVVIIYRHMGGSEL